MKKLLSLLSVLTISGTAVPTTIAASPYKKEQLNININYQRTNNLENLNRNKRQINWEGLERKIIDSEYMNDYEPIFLNNKIYATSNVYGSSGFNFLKYNLENGNTSRITYNTRVTNKPFIINDEIYIVTYRNVLKYNEKLNNFEVLFNLPESHNRELLTSGNNFYIITNNNFYKYDTLEKKETIIFEKIIRYFKNYCNNNLYFVFDEKIYEYDVKNNKKGENFILKKEVTHFFNRFLPVFLNNKIYYINDNKVYEYDVKTKYLEKIIDDMTGKFITIINNDIYFKNNKSVLKYNLLTKVKNELLMNCSSRFWNINNKFYFSYDDNLFLFYEYDPVTEQQKQIISTEWFQDNTAKLNLLLFEKKFYLFVNDSDSKKIYQYDPVTKSQEIILTINSEIKKSNFETSIAKSQYYSNILYFIANSIAVYEYNTETKEKKEIFKITNEDYFKSRLTILNNSNRMYIVKNNGVYEYIHFESLLNNDPLLLEWSKNFKDWSEELNRQIKDVIPGYTLEQKVNWSNEKNIELKNYLHQFNQDIQIVKNKEKIIELEVRTRVLEKNVNTLSEEINKINSKIQDLINKEKENPEWLNSCQNITTASKSISGFVPGIGPVLSTISSIGGVLCKIYNSALKEQQQ